MNIGFVPGEFEAPKAGMSEAGRLHVQWFSRSLSSLSLHGEPAEVVAFLAKALEAAQEAAATEVALGQTSGQA